MEEENRIYGKGSHYVKLDDEAIAGLEEIGVIKFVKYQRVGKGDNVIRILRYERLSNTEYLAHPIGD